MNSFHPNQYPLGPLRMADGVLADSTSGPFFSNASNFDKSCPCPCLSEQEYFKRQCDRHQSDLEFLIEKIASKAAELTRVNVLHRPIQIIRHVKNRHHGRHVHETL